MSVNNQKIIEICKKAKRLTLFSDGGDQWISAGGAIYPLLKVPHLTEETVRALYSLPDNVKVEEVDGLPVPFSFINAERDERPVFYEKIQLQPGGDALVSLRTREGVTFIEEKYLKPLEPGENGDCMLYERTDSHGHVYIAAKQGMMLEAVILPQCGVLKPDWLDDLQSLVSALRQTYEKEAGQ